MTSDADYSSNYSSELPNSTDPLFTPRPDANPSDSRPSEPMTEPPHPLNASDSNSQAGQLGTQTSELQPLQQKIADLSRQEAALRQEIDDLQVTKATLQQQVAEAQSAIARISQTCLSDLEQRRQTLQIAIEQLERRQERIKAEMRTTFAGSSQELAIRLQGFKDYLVGSLQDLVTAAEQIQLAPPVEDMQRPRPTTSPTSTGPTSTSEFRDSSYREGFREAPPGRDLRRSDGGRTSPDRSESRPPDLGRGESARADGLQSAPRSGARSESGREDRGMATPKFAEGFGEQQKRISQLLDQYRMMPDYYGPPWQLRRTFEPVHADRISHWLFSQAGRGAVKSMSSRLQNTLVAAAGISVLRNLYGDRLRVLVVSNTPERLGEWRRGLQDCLGISRGDFGSDAGIILFDDPEPLAQRADRLLRQKLMPLIIIDESESVISLSLLQFPLWLAFAPDPANPTLF